MKLEQSHIDEAVSLIDEILEVTVGYGKRDRAELEALIVRVRNNVIGARKVLTEGWSGRPE